MCFLFVRQRTLPPDPGSARHRNDGLLSGEYGILTQSFDLVVLGVGMAAVSAANKCAAAGWSVAVVDELPYGGTCALRGCDPKKLLRRGAEIINDARLMRGKGVKDDDLRIDWGELVAFKRSFTDKMPGRIESGFDEKGIVTLHGHARFLNENTVEIGGGTRIQGRHILIATGAVARPLSMPGSEHAIDNAGFMDLDELPKRILFIGGGYISFEFAHIAVRAGSSVCIADHGPRPLRAFDPDLVDRLVAHSRDLGIDIRLNVAVQSIERVSDGFLIRTKSGDECAEFTVDLVVHGAGRVPAVDQLNLSAANIERTDAGIRVNAHLQSVSNPAVYAAGDAAGTAGPALTPVAVAEGKVAASNMLKGNHAKADYSGVPSVVFTIPELARVGMLESEAREAGYDVRMAVNDTSDWFSNFRVGESCAATRIVIDAKTDRILGAHLLGPGYAELINYLGLAIRTGLKVGDLNKMIAAYPTISSDLGSIL
ncbi:glutathione reductase (NADPH) [Stakelama pacifica]|uniref:Glutathione reductase (NADPH) n=1 Tax=Stakelama pacifica TaxID=517720 RepID=A0A4R6FUB9_9SPHN|nr:glutathione reductase (NADPH) [Stakelama pacifica]GGO93055.1 putative FAD-dependent pyridine nucleotide-disulphide oxidoreductase [Stakelama pacifica]